MLKYLAVKQIVIAIGVVLLTAAAAIGFKSFSDSVRCTGACCNEPAVKIGSLDSLTR
jgi:hypothetical protein